ncbi:hypothetical protein [Actinopolyspora mortivallis]|uniref:hypothetical protein n=1 Tax=Actinopolyspora mortivallis TaxID=33906 RepID=UPI00037C2ECD|nr:hypothetical protein [Actinopolyspora mortivallis]
MSETLMWEARAAVGRQEELLDWVGGVLEGMRDNAACRCAGLYRGGDHRVVVLVEADGLPPELPPPPEELLSRPARQWTFRRVRRHVFR